MGEISAASGEQHTGIEQVNQAIMQMDEVTQQNAALVEEASAAAQSMAAQSNTLRELVSIFTIDASDPAAQASGFAPANAAPVRQPAIQRTPAASSATAVRNPAALVKDAAWQTF